MKLRNLFSITGIALFAAVSVGAGVALSKPKAAEVKAYGNDDAYWYVAGSFNSWTLQDDATHLTYSKMAGNNWEYESDEYIEFKENDQFKFVYSWGGTPETTNYFTPALMTNSTDFTGGNDSNFVASRDIKVKFFLQIYGSEGSWMGVYWEEYEEPAADPVYTIKNRNNAPVEFELDEEDKPEGVVHQYSAQVQYAKRGGRLQFYKDGVEITSGIGVDAGDAEHINNVHGDVTNGFYLAHTCNYTGYTKIFLKTYSDGGISLWGEGYSDNIFSTTLTDGKGGTQYVNMSLDTTFVPNETYIRQYKTSSAVSIKALAGTEWASSFDLMCSALDEDVAPEAGATNNARQAFQSTAWKVHNDCEEVIYVKERKTDLALFLYVGGYEEAHVLTIGGKNVSLHKVAENKYAATGVSLTAGDTVTAYTIEGVEQTVSAEVVGNNNLNVSKKVLVTNASADIYFDTQTSELWISGLPSGGYHLYKNSSSVVVMVKTEDYGEYQQWKTESVSFAVGDTVEILDTNGEAGVKGPAVWTITNFEESPMSANFEVEDGKIKCKTACTTSVYLKLKYEDDRIYFGAEAQHITKAKEFANSFKSAMEVACSAKSKKDAVEEAWAEQATAFAALVQEAQDELKLGSFSSVEEVKEFGERYVSIKQQHSTWTLENFLSWDIPVSSPYAGLDEFNATNSNAMIIVIAFAAVSTLALTTLLVFKKRKQR